MLRGGLSGSWQLGGSGGIVWPRANVAGRQIHAQYGDKNAAGEED